MAAALQVVVAQTNGVEHPLESIHVLHIGRMRMKLSKEKTTVAKEYYSSSMQVSNGVASYSLFAVIILVRSKE